MKGVKYFLFVLVLVLLISNISASVTLLKPAKVDNNYIILQTCASCTYVNLTISNVDGILFSNQPMSDNGSGVWTFNMTPTIISRHDVTGQGDLNGIDTSFVTFFEVTPSGKTASTGDSLLYLLFSGILFFIISILIFFAFTMPSGNEENDQGFEAKVLRIKYFKVLVIVLIYGLTILLLNFLNGLAVNFSALSMFAGILGFLFEIMLRLAWIFTFLMVVWIVVMLVHDTNLKKQMKRWNSFNPQNPGFLNGRM